MDAMLDALNRAVTDLIGRANGPLHFRLLMMPTVVTILAIRAGLKDAQADQTPFLWALLTMSEHRSRLLRSALKDIGRVFIVAIVLDTVYQFIVFTTFHIGEAFVVAVACAIVPYVLIRGPVTRLTRFVRRITRRAAHSSVRSE